MVFIKFGNLCCFFPVFPPLPGTPIMYMLDCIFPHVIVLCLLFSFTSLYFILNKFCCQVFQYTSLLFLPCLICCPFPPEYFSIQILWFSCLGITLSFLYVQFLFLSWSIMSILCLTFSNGYLCLGWSSKSHTWPWSSRLPQALLLLLEHRPLQALLPALFLQSLQCCCRNCFHCREQLLSSLLLFSQLNLTHISFFNIRIPEDAKGSMKGIKNNWES